MMTIFYKKLTVVDLLRLLRLGFFLNLADCIAYLGFLKNFHNE